MYETSSKNVLKVMNILLKLQATLQGGLFKIIFEGSEKESGSMAKVLQGFGQRMFRRRVDIKSQQNYKEKQSTRRHMKVKQHKSAKT